MEKQVKEYEAIALRYYLVGIMYGSPEYRKKCLEKAKKDTDLPKRGYQILEWLSEEFVDYKVVKR